MQQHKKTVGTSLRRGAKGREAHAVLQSANGYIVRQYPFGCLGKNPQRLVGTTDFWIVPVYFTSPGHGAVGQVALVAVDARTHQVVSATERPEVNRAIKHLKETRRDELEAAFLQARTV